MTSIPLACILARNNIFHFNFIVEKLIHCDCIKTFVLIVYETKETKQLQFFKLGDFNVD